VFARTPVRGISLVCQYVHSVSGLNLACSVTPCIIVLHICSVPNMHVCSPLVSVGIMLYCGDFCTQLTILKSPHNKEPGRFCCHLVLTSCSCDGGELCCVASLLKSNGQTQVADVHKWNTYVIFWCKKIWKHFVNVFFIAKANDGVISHYINGHHREERYATLYFTLYCNGEKNIWSRKCLSII